MTYDGGSKKLNEEEIVVVDGETMVPVIETKSIVELRSDVRDYYDLTVKLDNIKRDPNVWIELMDADDNKAFSNNVSREIWYAVINSTKPLVPQSTREAKTLGKIYKLLFEYAVQGEYPLLQQLCNYLGVNMEEFFRVMSSSGHPDRNAYIWAYSVFESAAQMNSIRNNGNANARQWIDKSREYKIATEDRVNLTIEGKKVDKLDEIGAELAKELLGGGK